MKCDSCFHKPVCIHYENKIDERYGYTSYNFDPDECGNYINSENVMIVNIGVWVRDSFVQGAFTKSHCSICGYETHDRSKVCPRCTAKMTGGG